MKLRGLPVYIAKVKIYYPLIVAQNLAFADLIKIYVLNPTAAANEIEAD